MTDIPAVADREHLSCDVAVVGGGTAGTMAAITAAEHGASVLLLEKAHVRHSGALAMGMDGVNNAVIPGKATPEDYVAEITRANDGIVNQRTIYQTATRGYDMVRRLERYGVKFAKDAAGDYDVRRVHRSGNYVRKAAIIALVPMSSHPSAAAALRAATDDSDADVRAYARRANTLPSSPA